ncbi:MAG: hypothetical protein ABI700_28540, partial [Chloroflexota bacterium]
MQATVLHITDRKRERLSQISSLDNFTTTSGETVDAQVILDNPNISLYCLDHDAQQAVFAELPAGIDLSQIPFYYQGQFDHAQRLLVVPYHVFHRLADQIPPSDPIRLILIHNIGRCGSTLLSTALNELDGVISFSEPDVFTNFVLLRYHNRSELIRLLHSCLRMVFRPAVVGQAATYSLKFRNQCVEIMDLYYEAFPQAKHLFLYRSAFGWLASVYRLMSRGNPPPPMSRAEAISLQAAYGNRTHASTERFFDPAIETYSMETYMTAAWLVMMDRALELFSQGMIPLALRYEDLTAQPERVLSALFDACDLPKTGVPLALRAFERDSQENTKLARDDAQSGNSVKLPAELILQIQAILNTHPVIRQAD